MDTDKKLFSRTFLSLRIRNFRLYFIGQAISLCGTWMQTIGQSWLVLKLTNSGTQLGFVLALQFLPMLVLGPWGGVIADRFNKRKILYFTQSISGVLALILGILVATATVKIWMVYFLAFGLGLVNTIDNPARQTFVPEMVGKDNLPNAIGLFATEISLARAVGPAIGGGIIVTLGLAPCFFINAISYIAVLVILFMMNKNELHFTPLASKTKGQLRKGLRYVRSSPILKYTLLMMAIIGTLSFELPVSLPLFAQFTFHGNAGSYAILVVATGLGSALGGLMSASRRKIAPHMLVSSALFFGLTFLIAAFMPSLALAFVFLFLSGIFSINFISLGNTTLQSESVPEMRGRVMALWAMAFLGSTAVGGPIIGWIGEYAGPRWGIATGGLAAIIAAGLGAMTLLKKDKLEAIPTDVEITSSEASAEADIKIR